MEKSKEEREEELENIQNQILQLKHKHEELKANHLNTKERSEIIKQFKELVKPTSILAEKLGDFTISPSLKKPYFKNDNNKLSHLFFCGYLSGDLSERSHFPISLFGGWFIKTPYGNILFDPGTGTRSGLKEMGVGLNEIDIIVVSHYHFSVRYDLHLILNELGAFSATEQGLLNNKIIKKVIFLSTEAVINGRNGNPSVLTSHYSKVISPEPIIIKPFQSFYIKKINKKCVIEPVYEKNSKPKPGYLLLKTFPAFHNEVTKYEEKHDSPGILGRELSSFFLQTNDYGVYYTNDTEYNKIYEKILKALQGKVNILIANMKTIEYRHKKRENDKHDEKDTNDWGSLRLTENQLGFEGTKRLTGILKPKALVLRALGLECVVEIDKENNTLYTPEKLSVYRNALDLLLKKHDVREIIIPVRHEIIIDLSNDNTFVDMAIVPTIPSKTKNFEKGFVTCNDKLVKNIEFFMEILRRENRPFIVIQGETGIGKTFLAESIAYHLIKERLSSKIKDENEIENKILRFDLATLEKNSSMFANDLFGWAKGLHFPEDKGHEGLLSLQNGILILNQLEKIPMSESQKFLDLLECWNYKQRCDNKPRKVKVKIIFTTNIDIDDLSNITDDLKNRIRDRCLTIPPLNTLSSEERSKELSIIINKWCKDENVLLDTSSWGLLLKADLCNGAHRCLRNLLKKAKFLASSSHGIFTIEKSEYRPIIFINNEYIEKAMKENGVSLIKQPSLNIELISKSLAWIITIWISYSCKNKITCDEMVRGAGRSTRWFRKTIQEFRLYFKCSEKAWNFFANAVSIDLLNKNDDIEEYVNSLNVLEDGIDVAKLFVNGNNEKWLQERSANLKKILSYKNKIIRSKFYREVDK